MAKRSVFNQGEAYSSEAVQNNAKKYWTQMNTGYKFNWDTDEHR